MSAAVEAILGKNSPLKAVMPGFMPRAGQMELACAVAESLEAEEPLVAEAGTGIGKTLAYLIPVLDSGLKTVISTGTKNLQDQIAEKELPLLKSALAPRLEFAVLKGRSNYLCLRRYLKFSAQPDLKLGGVKSAIAVLEQWLEESRDGDLDQVRGAKLPHYLISEITSHSEQCLGSRCPHRADCFLMEARRKAAEAQVIVANHHLFLADLKLKNDGHGEALPRYQAVVFDEAHLLPDVATQVFGVSVSQSRFKVLLRDIAREASSDTEAGSLSLMADTLSREFFRAVRMAAGNSGRKGLSTPELTALKEPSQNFQAGLEDLGEHLQKADSEEHRALGLRALTIALDMVAAAQPVPGQTIAWAEAGRNPALHLSPVQPGPHLSDALYGRQGKLIFTSATLSADGKLSHFKARMGLDKESAEVVLPSPFNQAENALLYVPKTMPPPAAPKFPEAVAKVVLELTKLSKGRAFVLFTSHRNLSAVADLLKDELAYPMLVQGDLPKAELLKIFQEKSPCVLLATNSFWQGVDVPGEALSAVIVDKLPFAPPDEPLVAARCEQMEEDGKSCFAHLMVPEAILSLRQGLGRLLRTESDRGLLAVLDTRLVEKGYGRRFLKALAPVPWTRNIADIAEFFQND